MYKTWCLEGCCVWLRMFIVIYCHCSVHQFEFFRSLRWVFFGFWSLRSDRNVDVNINVSRASVCTVTADDV